VHCPRNIAQPYRPGQHPGKQVDRRPNAGVRLPNIQRLRRRSQQLPKDIIGGYRNIGSHRKFHTRPCGCNPCPGIAAVIRVEHSSESATHHACRLEIDHDAAGSTGVDRVLRARWYDRCARLNLLACRVGEGDCTGMCCRDLYGCVGMPMGGTQPTAEDQPTRLDHRISRPRHTTEYAAHRLGLRTKGGTAAWPYID
jgi:hypothetical protein